MPTPADIRHQRRRAVNLLVFGVIRIILWTIMAGLIGLGLLHVPGFYWAKILATSLPFVVLISLYANWATDLDGATAAFASLVASDARQDVHATGLALTADLDKIESDIGKLANLDPGPEATRLAGDIRRRLIQNRSAETERSV
jgi:uncharacterized membrane protein